MPELKEAGSPPSTRVDEANGAAPAGSPRLEAVDDGHAPWPDPPESLHELAAEVLMYPEAWFDEPNPKLGGRRPRELEGTTEEFALFNMLRAAYYGTYA